MFAPEWTLLKTSEGQVVIQITDGITYRCYCLFRTNKELIVLTARNSNQMLHIKDRRRIHTFKNKRTLVEHSNKDSSLVQT